MSGAPSGKGGGVALVPVANKGLVTVSVMLATMMQSLDTTIANVALPHMQGSLNAAQDTITWVLTSYVVAAAIATPLTGWLADAMGRKRLFMIAVVGFTVASMLCGVANSLGLMVLFRLLQGIFGAALVPLSQSVILDINPPEKHGSAMAMWGAGIMVAPILGPTLGGWLTDTLNWRWVFYINVPIGILAFLGMAIFLPTSPLRKRSFDLFGFGLLAVSIGGLQMMLDRGQQLDWFSSGEIMIEATASGVAFWMFLIHSFTAKHPFIEPRLFADRNLATGVAFIFVVGIILLATMALLPPMLEQLLGYPTVITGFVLAPRGVGTMVSMLVVGRVMRYLDARVMMLAGLLATALSLWQMGQFSIIMGVTPLVISGLIQGIGLGLIFVPLSSMAFTTLNPALRTEGAAMFSLSRNLGSSIGVSAVTALLVRFTATNHAQMASILSPYNRTVSPMVTTPYPYPGFTHLQLWATFDGMATDQASMIGYLDDYKLMMWITLATIPLLLILRKPKRVVGAAAAKVDVHMD